MGIVIRQSFWTTVFAYLGVVIGFVNSLFLLPKYFTPEQLGLYGQIQSAALLLAPLAMFGMGSAIIKFYPAFSNNSQNKFALQGLALIMGFSGFVLLLSVMVFFRKGIIGLFAEKSPEVGMYYPVIIILLLIVTCFTIFEAISRANHKIIVPNLIKDVFIRFAKMIFIVLFGFHIISFQYIIYSLIGIFAIALLLLAIYLQKEEAFGFNSLLFTKDREKLGRILSFSFFSVLSGVGGVIVMNVDMQMITAMAGTAATGVYMIAFYMATIIDMPRKALVQIINPILSQMFEENRLDKVKELYKSLSINQAIIGSFIYLSILINLDNIYEAIPNDQIYAAGKIVVLTIGFTRLLDMSFSVNSEIIAFSRFYKFNVITVIILAVITIATNLWLIPIYGINGAAYASFISSLIFNCAKLSFIWWKFRMFPFTFRNLWLLAIAGVVLLVNSILPVLDHFLLDLIFRSAVYTILFGGLVISLKVSADVNKFIFDRVLSFIKKN